MVPLQYLRTIEILLINCEIIILLAWSENCIIITWGYDDPEPNISITDTKFNVLVATLSAQDNEKLLQQLKPGFERTIK